MKKNKSNQKSNLKDLLRKFIKKFLIFIILPLYLFIFKVIKSKDKLFKKILKSLGIFFFVIPFSFIVDLIILFVFLTLFYWTGIIKYPMEIIGQSMMPTLTNHQYLYMHPYNNWMFWKSKINRGDIITFKDDKTDGKTYVKRIVGLPGDDLEIRNGFIYINGKLIDEPYASKYRSTYGGTFLSECKEIKIPQNNIFAMGDNRAGSKDSREIGYVLISDIQTILYYDEQNFLSDRWKNGNKSKDVNVSMLSVSDYVQLVNKLRADNNLKPLKLNSGLTKSAELRANAMLKFDDLSLTATKSGYPMSRSMADAGYGNTIYVEYPVLGYYDANDLYNYVIEISKDKNFLLDKDFQDIGIATVIGNLNNCPVQLVLQQVAGYIPPNYKAETIDSWGRVINNMDEIIPSWEKMKSWQNVNKNDLNKLIGLLYRRKNNAEAIYYRMKANQWLTSGEEAMVAEDKSLYDQAEILAKKLNGK